MGTACLPLPKATHRVASPSSLRVPVPTPTSCPFSLGWVPTDAGPRVSNHPNPTHTSVNNLFITLSSMTYFFPFFPTERNQTGGSEDPHLSQLEPAEWPQRLSEYLGMQVCGCLCVGAGPSGGEDPLGSTIQKALSSDRRSQYLVSRKQGARTETSSRPRTAAAVFQPQIRGTAWKGTGGDQCRKRFETAPLLGNLGPGLLPHLWWPAGAGGCWEPLSSRCAG